MVKDTVKDKIVEIDLKIKALEKIKAKSDNKIGFDLLIADLNKKKDDLLNLKGGDA